MTTSNQITEIFRTVDVGTYRDVNSLSKAIGFVVSPFAHDLLRKTKISRSRKTLNLVVYSLQELGLAPGRIYADLCQAASRLGLELCPAEVGPQLRLQYRNQPENDVIYVVMEALKFSGPGDLFGVFVVNNSFDGQRLGTLLTDDFCQDNFKYAFVRN